MEIAMIGAGGIACTMIHTLTRMMGPGDHLTIFDGDRFEERNSERQFLCKPGENKAKVLEDSVGSRHVEGRAEFIRTHAQLEDYDIIISCVDNNDTRLLLKDASDAFDSLLIIGANEHDVANGFVYRMDLPEYANPFFNYPNLLEPDGLHPGGSCQREEHLDEFPQTVWANHAAGLAILSLFHEWKDVDLDSGPGLKFMPYEITIMSHTMEVKKIQ